MQPVKDDSDWKEKGRGLEEAKVMSLYSELVCLYCEKGCKRGE